MHNVSFLFVCLDCPSNKIRLISTDNDVEELFADSPGLNGFDRVATASTVFNEDYFIDSTVPNTGNLTFSERVVLIGITSAGIHFDGFDRYVTSFTFQYSNSLTGPYDTYPLVMLL